jgi:hypothetical protein
MSHHHFSGLLTFQWVGLRGYPRFHPVFSLSFPRRVTPLGTSFGVPAVNPPGRTWE